VEQPGSLLPSWRSALAVVAHPDDETFGLGALIHRLTASGTAVHVLCFTRGGASTLNENDSDLSQARARELERAGSALGAATVILLNYPDSRLAGIPPGELTAEVTRLPPAPAPMACWSSMAPATPTTRPLPALRCTRQAPRGCRCWPGPCLAPSPAGCARKPVPVRRPAARPHRSVRLRGPGRAAQGRVPARQPDLARRRAMAAAAR
jgi:hypothetical protein